MILKGEKIYIIEITGRVGANCLPELVEINFGIEYYKMIALMALSETPLALWNKRRNNIKAGYSKMIFSNDVNGIINSLSCDVNNDPDVREVTFLKSRRRSKIFESSNDCIGQIIVEGTNMEMCKIKCRKL